MFHKNFENKFYKFMATAAQSGSVEGLWMNFVISDKC